MINKWFPIHTIKWDLKWHLRLDPVWYEHVYWRPSVGQLMQRFLHITENIYCSFKIYIYCTSIIWLCVQSRSMCSCLFQICNWKIIHQITFDLFQSKTSTFSTRALIWVNFKTVHYFSQPIFSLFSYLKKCATQFSHWTVSCTIFQKCFTVIY